MVIGPRAHTTFAGFYLLHFAVFHGLCGRSTSTRFCAEGLIGKCVFPAVELKNGVHGQCLWSFHA
jgi:hypothetical protein